MASHYLAEYNARMRMRELGFTTSFDELDDLKAKVFILIGSTIDKEREAESKRKARKK